MHLRSRLPIDLETKPVLWGAVTQATLGVPLVVQFGLSWVFLSAVLAGAVVGVLTTDSRMPVAINGAAAAVLGSAAPIGAAGFLEWLAIGGDLATGGAVLFVVAYTVVLSVVLGVFTGLLGYTAALVSESVREQAHRRLAE